MDILNPSRFTLFSMKELHLLIGFKGGIYSLRPELYSLLSGETPNPPDKEQMLEELKRIDQREGDSRHLPSMPGRTLRALCLNITSSCNLNCEYCFAESEKAENMTLATAKNALKLLLDNSDPDSTLQIDFFGGEPLLNFELVKEFIPFAKATNRDIKFTLTTNGLLLTDEVLDFLNREEVSLILSLDGDKKTNDLNRKSPNGVSVWDTIISNIKNTVASRKGNNYYIRGTFTPSSLNITDTAKFFTDNELYRFSLEGAKGNPGHSWAISDKNIAQIKKEYEKLAAFILEKRNSGLPIDFFHFNVYLDTPLCAPRRLSGCGAGVEYISISPDGKIYPCHQLHSEDFSMGALDTISDSFKSVKNKFFSSNIETKKGCSQCWARFYCSGGCHASSWAENSNIDIPSETECSLQRHRIKCAIWLEAMSKLR